MYDVTPSCRAMQSAVNNRGKDGAALVQKTAQLKLTELHNVLLCHAVLYCTVLHTRIA